MSKDIKVGDAVIVTEGRYEGVEFVVREVKELRRDNTYGKRYAIGDGAELGVWFKHLKKINPTKPDLATIVEDIATGVALQKINAYRKELMSDLHSIAPEARPIRQAKLSAVNEIIRRLQ